MPGKIHNYVFQEIPSINDSSWRKWMYFKVPESSKSASTKLQSSEDIAIIQIKHPPSEQGEHSIVLFAYGFIYNLSSLMSWSNLPKKMREIIMSLIMNNYLFVRNIHLWQP